MFSVILLIPPNYSNICGHQLERGQPNRGLTTGKIWLSFSTSSCRLLIALQLGKKIHFYLSCLCLNFDCHTCMHVFFMLSQLLWVHLPCYILKSPFPCCHKPSRLLTIFPQSSARVPKPWEERFFFIYRCTILVKNSILSFLVYFYECGC